MLGDKKMENNRKLKLVRGYTSSEPNESQLLDLPKYSISLFLACTFYATLRYQIFKGVSWSDWPLYTLNKIIALFALALLLFATLSALFSGLSKCSKYLSLSGMAMMLHFAFSLCLLNPQYYPKFFVDGRLNLSASFSILIGIVIWAIFYNEGRRSAPRDLQQNLLIIGIISLFGGLHAAIPAWRNWFDISTWPGNLPPITIISFLVGVLTFGISAKGWLKAKIDK